MLEEIGRTTNRLPFNRVEMDVAISAVDRRRQQRHDLVIGDQIMVLDAKTMVEAAHEGFILFSSRVQLTSVFLFAKCNAGKGLFGGQKAVYVSYIRNLDQEAWQIGTTFKSWPIAVTSIGNVYRGNGF
jgi:hypothetical protein